MCLARDVGREGALVRLERCNRTRSGFLISCAFGAIAIALALASADAAAQCALCGQGTPYAGSTPGRSIATFLAASLVLLVPTFGAAAAVARTLWRHRDPQ